MAQLRAAKQATEEPERVLDLRLVPAALAAWAVTLLGLYLGWWASALCAALALPLTVMLLFRPKSRTAAGMLLVCGIVVAVAAIVSIRVHHSHEHPLRDLAQRGTFAELRVAIGADPRPLRTQGYGGNPAGAGRVAVPAELLHADVPGSNAIPGDGERLLLLAPADQWSVLLPGQHVTARGKLVPAEQNDLTVAVLSVRGSPAQVSEPPWWQGAAETLRHGLREASGVLAPEPAGLVPALVVGDTRNLAERVIAEFRTAGLTHLLAVSGANLAIVCGAVLLACRLLRLGPRTSGLLAGLALVGFVILARPEPSVLRAAVMGAIALLALVVGRERSALPALTVAVLLLLIVDSDLAVAPGFALSVLATAALVVLAPRWTKSLRSKGVPVGIAEALAVPAAAHLATAPVVAALSGQVSIVAVLANLVVAPAVAPVTILGVAAAATAPLSTTVAEWLVRLAGPPAHWLVAAGRWAAKVPGGELSWPAGTTGGLLLAALTLGFLVLLRFQRLRSLLAAGMVLLLIILVPTRVIRPGWPVTGWAAVACDVGQGDAIVLATTEPGRAVVVDTGPGPGPVDACLRRLGVQRIPVVVLSHLHADHIGGLEAVLDGRAVGAVAVGTLRHPRWAAQQVDRLTRRAGVPVLVMEAGHRVQLPGLHLETLGPVRQPPEPAAESDSGTPINDASLVLRATTPAGRILLTGDVELAGQSALLSDNVDLTADVLKVPHHGSRSTLPTFLAAVRPRVALVSAGAGNRYGHPSPLVVDALTSAGTRVLRTDQDGDIAVVATEHGPAVARRGEPRSPPR
ncbi:ComEC/Rec2 family competence protein [Longimycelium tulufanense]|nr:ComEC/Rec2 family competence protein [Longimycelium tulufanense]